MLHTLFPVPVPILGAETFFRFFFISYLFCNIFVMYRKIIFNNATYVKIFFYKNTYFCNIFAKNTQKNPWEIYFCQ